MSFFIDWTGALQYPSALSSPEVLPAGKEGWGVLGLLPKIKCEVTPSSGAPAI